MRAIVVVAIAAAVAALNQGPMWVLNRAAATADDAAPGPFRAAIQEDSDLVLEGVRLTLHDADGFDHSAQAESTGVFGHSAQADNTGVFGRAEIDAADGFDRNAQAESTGVFGRGELAAGDGFDRSAQAESTGLFHSQQGGDVALGSGFDETARAPVTGQFAAAMLANQDNERATGLQWVVYVADQAVATGDDESTIDALLESQEYLENEESEADGGMGEAFLSDRRRVALEEDNQEGEADGAMDQAWGAFLSDRRRVALQDSKATRVLRALRDALNVVVQDEVPPHASYLDADRSRRFRRYD
ncbi:Aste57867_16048 [Aphanomyces stellatus]|uniref:Aste57867_16048 protein n=1 Tax=Aphanomyces stellatus TaxID=120398 RepID=A0A485L4L8_9STRA|nr:hypothetical protein As57867_015992 [Aphanomyces stellatus]VFT92832.1 Aste57867_16048 [Aphanomyces stellatus]